MPEGPKRHFPTWLQAVILVLGGGLLGCTSCGAALSFGFGGGRHSAFWGNVFVAGSIAGAAAFLAGLLLFLFLALRKLFSQ